MCSYKFVTNNMNPQCNKGIFAIHYIQTPRYSLLRHVSHLQQKHIVAKSLARFLNYIVRQKQQNSMNEHFTLMFLTVKLYTCK